MGRRISQKKNAGMLDSDNTDYVSFPSTMRSNRMLVKGVEQVQVDKEAFLDECLDDLYEKRGSTREEALASIIEVFNSSFQQKFVKKIFATLLHQCLNSIKKGSAKEVSLASHVIGLLALTIGPGEKAQVILDESISIISQALKRQTETCTISSLLECLAVITFVGGEEPDETEKSMQIMWQVAHPKLGTNVVASEPSPAMIMAVVSSWSFLLTTMEERSLNPKNWRESLSYFSTLLDKDDRSLRIVVGESLALIFEMGNLEKFCGEDKVSSGVTTSVIEANDSRKLMYIHGLKTKVLHQVKDLSAEAGGKGYAKKDLNNQRKTFQDILYFIEDGYVPQTSVKIGAAPLRGSTWAERIQLKFLKHFLGGGFVKNMQENEFLHDVFGFNPDRDLLSGAQCRMSNKEKRLYKSPNSALNKARTQYLNKERKLSQDKNRGHYAVASADH